MPFCPISGKPVVLDNPVKTLVLSVDGEPQHFCCPGHEKRYLRENPGARKVTLHVPLASSPQLGAAVARENKVRIANDAEGLTVISEAARIGGQRVVLSLFRREDRDAPDFWNIALLVGATRQAKKSMRATAEWPAHYEGKSTGVAGLRALAWAKGQMDEFQWQRPEAHLVTGGSDDRRLRMYTRALTRYGFVQGVYNGEDVVFRTNEMYREALARKPKQHDKAQLNPADLRGRSIPERYLAGLPPALRAQRITELSESRDAYGTGDFSELATDVKAREMGLVKKSKYRVLAESRGFDVGQVGSYEEMIDAAVQYYAGRRPTAAEQARGVEALTKVYAKGLAAWKSGGHRPGATAKNWADARLASLLVGGKGPRTADKKEFAMLPADVQAAIWREAPDVSRM